MDIFQIILGVLFLLVGSMLSYKTKDQKKIILSLILLIIGIALTLGGFNIKI